MSINLPGVTISTIDKSQLSEQLDNVMNIGLSVESPTGPYEITYVSNLTEFLDLYSMHDAPSADDHETMLHAMKLLQFTPLYVSRAGNSSVLLAITDKTDSSGNKIIYVDEDYSPFYKQWKFNFEQGGLDYKVCYLKFTCKTISASILSTENGLSLASQNGALIVQESSDSGLKENVYCIYIGSEKPSLEDVDNDKYIDVRSLLGDNEIEPTLENLFSHFNAAVAKYNSTPISGTGTLNDPYIYPNPSVSQLSNVLVTDSSISINCGLDISFKSTDIYPYNESDIFDDNIINSDYLLLGFNENNDKADPNDPSPFTQKTLGKSAYYNLNGVTYYNPVGSDNSTYPGTLSELRIYKEFEESSNSVKYMDEVPVGGKCTSVQEFAVYMNDKIVSLGNAKPVIDSSVAEVTVGLVDGFIGSDGVKYKLLTQEENKVSSDAISVKILGDSEAVSNLMYSKSYHTAGSGETWSYPEITINSLNTLYSLGNVGVAFTMRYTSSDNNYTEENPFIRTLVLSTGSVDKSSLEGDVHEYNMNDSEDTMATITKFVYRIAEFFTYKNEFLRTKFGVSSKWTISTELSAGTYYLKSKTTDEIISDQVTVESSGNSINLNPLEGEFSTSLLKLVYRSPSNSITEFNLTNDTVQSINLLGKDLVVIVTKGYVSITGNYITYPDDIGVIVKNCNYYYMKSAIDSSVTNLDTDVLLYDRENLADLDVSIHNYTLNSTSVSAMNKTYTNQYIKFTRVDGDNEQNYIFYTGTYPYSQMPNDTLVRLSAGKTTYAQFLSLLIDAVKTKFDSTPLKEGLALYEHDDSVEINITTYTGIIKKFSTVINGFNDLINNASLIVVSKYVNSESILRYTLDIHEDDHEIYTLKLYRKNSEESYDISFVPNKVDMYGVNIYYTYVNDEDNGSRDFYIFRENEDIRNLPEDHITSPLFGGEIMVTNASTQDYINSYNRFREKLGVYYDIIFDAGRSNVSTQYTIYNVCKDIYALGVLTEPDYKNIKVLKNYRESLGIDHWSCWMGAPRVPDTTLGDFLVYLSAGTQYIERLILNKRGGKEFAPCFYYTNGSASLKPKYKYNKDEDRLLLVNSQINPLIWDRARQQSYFLLDLTMQKVDSSLSDANNVRMVNTLSHICDSVASNYIGRYNDEETRDEFLSDLTTNIENRMIKNQTYHMYKYRLVCDTSNNSKEQIELRNLVLDVYVQFLPGVREVKVFQTVYKLSKDIDSI